MVSEEDSSVSFIDRKSIIPSLLPIKPSASTGNSPQLKDTSLTQFEVAWPSDQPFNRPHQIERVISFNVLPAELVSRLLATLHHSIQNNLVWRDEVLLFISAFNAQAWIRADPVHNRFLVTLRGSTREGCVKQLSWIVNEVKEVTENYPSIVFQECARSPHHEGSHINANNAYVDVALPKSERKLVCTETGLPICAEFLLFNAGFLETSLRSEEQGNNNSIDFLLSASLYFFLIIYLQEHGGDWMPQGCFRL